MLCSIKHNYFVDIKQVFREKTSVSTLKLINVAQQRRRTSYAQYTPPTPTRQNCFVASRRRRRCVLGFSCSPGSISSPIIHRSCRQCAAFTDDAAEVRAKSCVKVSLYTCQALYWLINVWATAAAAAAGEKLGLHALMLRWYRQTPLRQNPLMRLNSVQSKLPSFYCKWSWMNKAIDENSSLSHGMSPAMLDHTVLPATRHKWTRPALTTAIQ